MGKEAGGAPLALSLKKGSVLMVQMMEERDNQERCQVKA
jgi:hypothetical protein